MRCPKLTLNLTSPPTTPSRLEIQIIERFERESNPTLLVATLCLMEASARGLLETELLHILADEDHLAMPDTDKDADTEKSQGKA